MDEFSDDDVYAAEVHKDPKGDWLRVFRNGALCLDHLPIDRLLALPQVKGALTELAKAEGVPFRSWYEEMSRDD